MQLTASLMKYRHLPHLLSVAVSHPSSLCLFLLTQMVSSFPQTLLWILCAWNRVPVMDDNPESEKPTPLVPG